MKHDVAGLGNALVDALVRLPDDGMLETLELNRGHMHPKPHDRWEADYAKVEHLGPDVQSGGSCANTIATLGLMGLSARFCGQVGDDAFGKLYMDSLIDACGGHALQQGTGNTGKCLSLISAKDAERTLVTDLGTAVELAAIGPFADLITSSKVLHVTGYLFLGGPMAEAAWEAMDHAKAAGIPISLDVADPFVVSTVRDSMWRAVRDYADIVFLNEEEALALTGKEAHEALAEVAEVCRTTVVKIGRRGSLVNHDGSVHQVVVHPVAAVDTTGAGDNYAAGYLYGWCQGWDPEHCGDLGSRVAALAVAQLGAVVRDRAALQVAIEAARA
ncbi:MAG: adenosine kinase [Proteobacteria bacterium]|nr:adenosine kinase [Pseudomonadota bacterium]MCP4917022.1 adenosine kinase [Pseudomonadota bacterium]